MLKEFVPQEGDLVRVQLAKSIGYPRDYMLVVWPSPTLVPEFRNYGYGTISTVNVVCKLVINMLGQLNRDNIIGFSSNDKLVRPTIEDIFDISRVLYSNRLRYNRKTKQIIKLGINESNR